MQNTYVMFEPMIWAGEMTGKIVLGGGVDFVLRMTGVSVYNDRCCDV